MSPRTSADVIRKFAMALRGQSPDEYNAEDNHTRAGTEKQIETALQVTGFLMGTPLVPNNEYPYPGLAGLTVLGPEIFTDGEVINWRGENFVREPEVGTVQQCLTEFAGDRAYLCALSAGHYGDHTTGRGEHWQNGTTPQSDAPRFPQPPSPVDTGPWATLEQIPDNVEFRGTFSGGGGPTDSVWFKRDGALWHSRPGRPAVKEAENAYLGNLSPFVADVAAS